MRYRVVAKLLGALLILLSLSMMGCGIYDLCLPKAETTNGFDALMISAGITLLSGLGLLFAGFGKIDKVSRREGIAVVGLGWLFSMLFSALPFLYIEPIVGSGQERLDFATAFFEASSGITATGATALSDIEAWPNAILLWRAVTQWLGGLGILVIFVALMSYFGMGAKSLFRNESSFQTGEVSVARIKDTAMMILKIYLVITAICFLGLWAMGMTAFDAITHTMTTVSTGGFSPKNESIAYYSRWGNGWLIELWMTLFMIICSVSFLVWVVLLKKRWQRLKNEEEGKFFVLWCVAITVFVFIILLINGSEDIGLSLRQAWFTTVSLASTTGYVNVDYGSWPAAAEFVVFFALIMGGCAGSTTGGFKISRLIVMLRTIKHEVVSAFRPNKIDRIQVNGNRLSDQAQKQTVIFLVLFTFIFVVSVMFVSVTEMGNQEVPIDLKSKVGMVLATLSNGGPGIGSVGPVENFAHLMPVTKVFLSLLMVIGRLELFAILVLFVPSFWKKY